MNLPIVLGLGIAMNSVKKIDYTYDDKEKTSTFNVKIKGGEN